MEISFSQCICFTFIMGVGGQEDLDHKVLDKECEVLDFLCKKSWNSEMLVNCTPTRIFLPWESPPRGHFCWEPRNSPEERGSLLSALSFHSVGITYETRYKMKMQRSLVNKLSISRWHWQRLRLSTCSEHRTLCGCTGHKAMKLVGLWVYQLSHLSSIPPLSPLPTEPPHLAFLKHSPWVGLMEGYAEL